MDDNTTGYLLVKQTAVEFPGSRPQLGYTLLNGVGIFTTQEDVHDTIKEFNLPLGWASMTVEQLLPGWMVPAKPPMAVEALKELVELLPGLHIKYGTPGSRDVDVTAHNAKLDRIAQILKESYHE